jgi:hypothetical protein
MDISHMFGRVADGWQEAEFEVALEGDWGAAAAIGYAASTARSYADYAVALWQLHADDRPPSDPKSFIGWQWERSPAPHETGSFPAIGGDES